MGPSSEEAAGENMLSGRQQGASAVICAHQHQEAWKES